MYDASVKEPFGIEYGDTYQFGNFDECLSAFHHKSSGELTLDSAPKPSFNPQYCLADVIIQGYTIGQLSSRDPQIKVISWSAKNYLQITITLLFSPLTASKLTQGHRNYHLTTVSLI